MKLKSSLLYMILENSFASNRYSRAYLNLKNVIALEESEKHKFTKNVYDQFEELTKKFNDFNNEIPLIVIERYYQDYKDKPNKYCNLLFGKNQKELLDLQIMDLYLLLEDFFQECFQLACVIASMYNLEIKINSGNQVEENIL